MARWAAVTPASPWTMRVSSSARRRWLSRLAASVFARGVERFDFFVRQRRHHPQDFADVGVFGADPVLIELVRARALRRQPDGAGFGLAHLGAVGFGEQRRREPCSCAPTHAPAEIDAGRDVAPLIAAADLQLAIEFVVEVNEVVRLQQHVAEFGVAETRVSLHRAEAAFDRVFGQHHVDGKVLADVAEEFEVAERADPIEVVDELRGIRGASKSRKRRICSCMPATLRSRSSFESRLRSDSCRWGRRSCRSRRRRRRSACGRQVGTVAASAAAARWPT